MFAEILLSVDFIMVMIMMLDILEWFKKGIDIF